MSGLITYLHPLGNSSKRMPYLCEVEYLESDGNQYIDTGIKSSSDIDFEVNAKSASSGQFHCFGYWNGTDNKFAVFNSSTTELGIQFGYGDGASGSRITSKISWSSRHTVLLKNKTMYVDGVKIGSATYSFTDGGNMWFGAINNITKHAGYLYTCKIWYKGVLLRDLIPVLDMQSVPCMFDNITGQLFYNAGAGQFTAGRRIYPVEYLEGTGTQYIDLGMKLTQNSNIEIEYSYDDISDNFGVFGARTTANSNNIGLMFFIQTGGILNSFVDFNNSNYSTYRCTFLNPEINVRYTTQINKNTRNVVGYSSNDETCNDTITTEDNALLFKIGGSPATTNCMKGKIYSCKIEGSHDFIPAIDENRVGYMFDKVTHVIHDNAGTGVFSFGRRKQPDIEPIIEEMPYMCDVEYLESSASVQYIDTGYCALGKHPIVEIVFSTNVTTTAGNQGIFGTWGTNDTRLQIVGNSIGIGPYVNAWWTKDILYTVTLDTVNLKATINNIDYSTWTSTDSEITSGFADNGFPNNNLMLFTRYDGTKIDNSAGVKIYSYKVYEDDVLIQDFKPVLDWNCVPCMYDKVSGKFFYNEGTDQFTYGKCVFPVEYIGQTEHGTQTHCPYIRLPFVPTVHTRCKLKTFIRNFSVRNGIGIGCRTADGRNSRYFPVASNVDGDGFRFVIGEDPYINYQTEFNKMFDIDFNMKGHKINVNGEELAEAFSDITYTTGTLQTFQIFELGAHNNYSQVYKVDADVYYLQLYKPDYTTLEYDLVAAKDENGIGFLFDKVKHKIYNNQYSGGNFNVGEEIKNTPIV